MWVAALEAEQDEEKERAIGASRAAGTSRAVGGLDIPREARVEERRMTGNRQWGEDDATGSHLGCDNAAIGVAAASHLNYNDGMVDVVAAKHRTVGGFDIPRKRCVVKHNSSDSSQWTCDVAAIDVVAGAAERRAVGGFEERRMAGSRKWGCNDATGGAAKRRAGGGIDRLQRALSD